MKWTESTRWLLIAGLAAGIMTACGDDVSTDAATPGGAGKEAAAGADTGTGATANGNAGASSNPGDAGAATGGSNNSSGAGPGTTGGDASASGGDTAAPHVAMCQEACKGDKDCLDGYKCTDARCVSTAAPATCKSDELCQAQLSGWTTECNEQSDCLLTQVCVDIGEAMGRCATKAGGAVSCATLQQDDVATKDIDGKAATVCGKARAACDDNGACVETCAKDSCPQYFACNADSGACECDNDKACANQPNVSKCVAGRCVCADDGDCTSNANKCNDGVCGCGDASVCDAKAAHPGTSWVCE
jgi:hypothetical protein